MSHVEPDGTTMMDENNGEDIDEGRMKLTDGIFMALLHVKENACGCMEANEKHDCSNDQSCQKCPLHRFFEYLAEELKITFGW